MPLPPLAGVEDLAARGVAVAGEEEPFVAVYLGVASEAVRAAAGVAITMTTSTVTLLGRREKRLRLPGAPVTAVTAVSVDGEDLPATAWRLIAGELYRIQHGRSTWWAACRDAPVAVTVTLTHGLPEVPADIVDLICRMVITPLELHRAAAAGAGSGLGVDRKQSERIGDYSVSYDYSSRMTEMQLTEPVAAALAARFGGGAAMVVSSS